MNLAMFASSAWRSLPDDDREAHRSGVELASWTNRQVRRNALCMAGWLDARERARHPLPRRWSVPQRHSTPRLLV